MKATFALVLIATVLPMQDVEKRLIDVSNYVEFAVLPVWYCDPSDLNKSGVVGTGFLVTPDGHFITAAHVVEQYLPNSGRLTAVLRQRSRDGGGAFFELVEKDEAHDLALCKIVGSMKFIERKDNPGTEKPIATLHISAADPITGRFIAIAGFPLGSWELAIQLGTIAAIRTTNPNAGRVPAGQRELLQISASGNKGNSGGPVIDLDTGDVVGVIIQAQPAPLFGAGANLPIAQSSGIMLAVPASWVRELLKRHNVESVAQHPPEGHTSYYGLPTQ